MASGGAVAQWPLRHTVGKKLSCHEELNFYGFALHITFAYSLLYGCLLEPHPSEHQTLICAYS